MMRKIFCGVMILLFGLTFQALADEPIGVFVNNNTDSIQFINPVTQNVSPSLLKGSLGSYDGGLFQVLITPDGKKAIVSDNFKEKLIFIDISGGFSAIPTIVSQVSLIIPPGEMALTPDGKYLLVVGSFGKKFTSTVGKAFFDSRVAVVNMTTQQVEYKSLGYFYFADAVAIAPDGKTVLFLDYEHSVVYSYSFDSSTGKFNFKDIAYLPVNYPNNIAISPDGKTILVSIEDSYKIVVLSFWGDSQLQLNGMVDLPAKGGQSFVFSNDGTKAYCLTNSMLALGDPLPGNDSTSSSSTTQVVVLNITAPGVVTVGDSIPLSIPKGIFFLIGIQSMAIDPSGNYLYITNSGFIEGVVEITVIDLNTNTEVNQLRANGIPIGIAFGIIKSS